MNAIIYMKLVPESVESFHIVSALMAITVVVGGVGLGLYLAFEWLRNKWKERKHGHGH